MSRPSPRELFDSPTAFWTFLTQLTDDGFEGQHSDRKEAGRLQPDGSLSHNSLSNLRELVTKTVSAFANRNIEGGILALGISSTGEVCGIDHLTEAQRNDVTNFNKLLLHHAAEIRFVDCTDSAGNAKTICLIFSGFSTTGICETLGNNPKAWTRNGSQCVLATQAVRDSLRIRKGLVSVESDPVCEFSLEDVDKEVIDEFRKVFQPEITTSFDETRLLKEAGAIVKKDGAFWFTMPGLLFFASNPQRVFAHAYVRLMRFGVTCDEFRNRGTPNLNKEFKGPITTQIRAARTFFRESGFFKRFEKRKPDGGFLEEPELPPLAIDEAIVNAVAHRDYCTKLPIECEAYVDGFVVKNPGRVIQRNYDPPDSFRLDVNPLDSTPRNSKLLEWLKLMRDPEGRAFVQAVSEGTKRMTAEMLALKLPAPMFKLAENESILLLQSNAPEREAAILAAAKPVASTESVNLFHLPVRLGMDPARIDELRVKYRDFLTGLRASLEANGWYVDRFSFSRITVHRRGNELPISAAARSILRMYPAYILQVQESFGHWFLSVDYACEVLSVQRLNHVLRSFAGPALHNKTCVALVGEWRPGRIVQITEDWTTVRFFDNETEQSVATSDVIPRLSLREIDQSLLASGVVFDLHGAIKRGGLASEPAAARKRYDKIRQCVNNLSADVFPISFGDFEVSLNPTPVLLTSPTARCPASFRVYRLDEPQVEFRDHHSSSDVREGITKFGSFESEPHRIELIPVCVAEYKDRMEQLIARLIEGKYKYRGSERTFATRFGYNAIVAVSSVEDIEREVARLLAQHADWCGARELNRLFLVQCPEQGYAADDELAPYYTVKRQLLEAGVPCQMIDSPTLTNPDWKDLNLALNIIAKCGVTPWVLPEFIPDADFFVGLSYTQSRDGQRIMGFANVFNSYGRWEFYAGNTTTFDVSRRSEHLAALVKGTLERLRTTHTVSVSANLVFHHSVRISRDDRSAILKSLRSVAPDVSATFVWINSHSNSRLFDARPETDGSVRRGSFVPVSKNKLLLSTTGYNPFRKAMGTPRPLELSALHFPPGADRPSDYDQRSLALQVLSLTKLNWASTDAFCGEPITVKYAGDIAYLTAAFLRQREPFQLHPSLESTPWFI